MKKTLSFIFPLFITFGFALSISAPALTVHAASPKTAVNQYVKEAAKKPYGRATENRLPLFIGNLIKVVLGVVGMIFLILTVYAGVLYMTAAGDDTKVKKAKAMLGQTVIGLVIIIGAYVLTDYIITKLAGAV